jgi:hypothetical protein
MNPVLVADSIVNIAGAVGVGVAILTFRHRDPDGAVTRLLNLALGILFGLLLLRGLFWWTGSGLLEALSLTFAAAVPLAAIIATEAALRRHAPRWAKLVVLTLTGALGILALTGLHGSPVWFGLPLAIAQLIGLGISAWLLHRRDATSLTDAENAAIQRLMLAVGLSAPLVLTDFRILFPDMPVRLGALGILLAVSLLVVAASAATTRRQLLTLMGWRIGAAALLGYAAAYLLPNPTSADILRFAAVAVAGVLAIGMMTDALRGLYEARAPGVLAAISAGRGETRAALLEELQRNPVFSGARRLRAAELAAFDPAILGPALAGHGIIRTSDWPWSLQEEDPAAERLLSLLRSHGATHLITLSSAPPDVVLVQVPMRAADSATETALALVRRLLAASPEEGQEKRQEKQQEKQQEKRPARRAERTE